MRERTETIMFIQQQLKQLHEKEHVSDLMEHGQTTELEAIELKLDYSVLNSYFDENDEGLELEVTEIPEECHNELAFYFRQCGKPNYQIFADEVEMIELFEEKQGDLADNVVTSIRSKDLCCLSLEELVFGIQDDEDDEDDDYDDDYDYEEEFWF